MSQMPPQGPMGYQSMAPSPAEANSKKIAAGICGILIGGFGVHKFILGLTTAGIIMLLVTVLTCGVGGIVMHVIGIVEGSSTSRRAIRIFIKPIWCRRKPGSERGALKSPVPHIRYAPWKRRGLPPGLWS